MLLLATSSVRRNWQTGVGLVVNSQMSEEKAGAPRKN
jgi:hypothetical protein